MDLNTDTIELTIAMEIALITRVASGHFRSCTLLKRISGCDGCEIRTMEQVRREAEKVP
jgi:hypothetical protein